MIRPMLRLFPFLLASFAIVPVACSTSSGGDSVSGTSSLTFVPTVAVWTASSGSCPECGSIMEAIDGGPAPSGYPSGPASYHTVAITLSDDPALATACAEGGGGAFSFDPTHHHYLTIEAVNTSAIAPGTFPVRPASAGQTQEPSCLFTEDRTSPDAGYLGYVFDDGPASGSLTLTSVGSSVSGSFSVDGLYDSRDLGDAGVSGTFAAAACPNLGEGPLGLHVCGPCPG
jgi:hypothetical protein